MQRTLPATEQLQQIEIRVKDLKENVIENIKNSQILRSNYTTILHTNKETNEYLKNEITNKISGLRADLLQNSEAIDENIKEMEKEIVSLNTEKRCVNDGILLLDQKIRDLEDVLGGYFADKDEI